MKKKEVDEYELAKSFLIDRKWVERWDEIYEDLLKEPCLGVQISGKTYTFNNHAKDFIHGLIFAQCLSFAQKVIAMQKSKQKIEELRDEIGKLLDEITPKK